MIKKDNKRARFLKKSKESVKEALKSRDMLLGSATRTIDDLDKTINLLSERFEEWYGVYFPELRMPDKIKYCEAALLLDLEDLDKKELASSLGDKKTAEIVAAAEKTLGTKLSKQDRSEMLSLAHLILSLDKSRKKYEEYQKMLAEELCPNMSAVAGSDIAAKLVSHVGSVSKLAMFAASAIQVMGAEKALFKHLKNHKIPPPKHGIIFQHVRISSSPKKVRGRIARALANKLSVAAKADAFTKRSISSQLKKEFDERYNEIMAQYAKEKKK